MVPYDDPAAFKTTTERFVSAPFVKRERIGVSPRLYPLSSDLGSSRVKQWPVWPTPLLRSPHAGPQTIPKWSGS